MKLRNLILFVIIIGFFKFIFKVLFWPFKKLFRL